MYVLVCMVACSQYCVSSWVSSSISPQGRVHMSLTLFRAGKNTRPSRAFPSLVLPPTAVFCSARRRRTCFQGRSVNSTVDLESINGSLSTALIANTSCRDTVRGGLRVPQGWKSERKLDSNGKANRILIQLVLQLQVRVISTRKGYCKHIFSS